MAKFEVWLVPVPPEGDFLYKEEKLVHEADTRTDAEEWAYLENADEPAPDKHEFRRYEIRSDCVACDGSGRCGPYWDGGLSTKCGNCA
jgi:hypothetical protein